jgi:hypothetical protein
MPSRILATGIAFCTRDLLLDHVAMALGKAAFHGSRTAGFSLNP